MSAIGLSYVPYHIARDILLHPNVSPAGRYEVFEAVVLFVDISGFSSMSEGLGKNGKAGTEELTFIINSYFQPMIDLIESYGGIVGKFGGDSITVVFPYTEATQSSIVRCAIQCSVDMQANMRRYQTIDTSAGIYSLAMKAGLAAGRVLSMTVGDQTIRLEYIIGGSVLDMSAEAEHHAARGEIVVHNNLLGMAGGVEIVEVRGDFTCVLHLTERALPAPLQPLGNVPASANAVLSAYLHPNLVRLLSMGQAEFIDEHRKVTVLFVSFSGFDYDGDPEVAIKLQLYLTTVIQIVHRYDGYLNKVDMGDKGSKYIIVFGAPVAHENDEERAMRCALELVQLPHTTIRIGINTGFVYCGHVGSNVRQEYTVMGDAVVLAARLMQAAAPSQILVSSFTQRLISRRFTWQDLPPITVKGKSVPVLRYELTGILSHTQSRLPEIAYSLPLVGRQSLLETVDAYLDEAILGKGQIVGISGEAGAGKSRINAEIIWRAQTRGFQVLIGEAQSYGTNVNYFIWHNIWRTFFGINVEDSVEDQIYQLETRLSSLNPDFSYRLPLVGVVVNLSIPDNRLTESLDGQTRLDLLFSLLIDCLYHQTQTPLLLVLEDCHWIDPGSLELLRFFARNIVDLPILLITITRPLDTEGGWWHDLHRFAHFHELPLTNFSNDESRQLILLKLAQLSATEIELPDEVIDHIIIRAGGNPFYLEEMINYILSQSVVLNDAASLEQIELPDSLYGLIISRIDQLSENEKMVLKVASVVGRIFKAHWLWSMYPLLGEPDKVRRYLENLHFRDLTPLDKSEPELEYLFKHILTQEVAYDSMTFATREQLHTELAKFIERAYPDHLSQYVAILAYHYGRSRDADKQRLYFRQAADDAKEAYSNEIAAYYYQRLLPLLTEDTSAPVLYELAEVWHWIGRWDEAEKTYRQVNTMTQISSDLLTRARSQCALGELLSTTGNYREAVEQLQGAQMAFENLNNGPGLILTLSRLSVAYLRQSLYPQVASTSAELLQLADRHHDPIGQVEANMNLGWMYLDQGDTDTALSSLQQAFNLSVEHQYQRGIVHASSDIARAYLAKGDFQQAFAACQHALTTAIQIGYRRFVGIVAANVGELYYQFSDETRALACRLQALSVFIELGDWTSVAVTISNLGEIFLAQGRYIEAEILLVRASELLRQLNIPYMLCNNLYLQAKNSLQQQRFTDALATNKEALEIAIQIEDQETQFHTILLDLRLQVLLGQLDVTSMSTKLEHLFTEWTSSEQRAALHYERWRLERSLDDQRQQAAELYHSLYADNPTIEYQRRYLELTSKILPPPAQLPDLEGVSVWASPDINQLLERIPLIVI